jgi:DNA polymerase (family X)
MQNHEIAQILENIADILELQNVQFKPRAYRKAAQTVEFLKENIVDVYKRGELQELPGIGIHIAAKIEELIKTGKLKFYTKLKKSIKIDIESLKEIPNLGPKKIKILYEKLKIKNVKDLEKAVKKHKVRELTGFGDKTEEDLRKSLESNLKKKQRFAYEEVKPIAKKLMSTIKRLPSVSKIETAGSFRRKKSTVGDLDILVVADDPMKVMEKIKKLGTVLVSGSTKTSIRLESGLQVDVRVVNETEYGAALLYFTGSKQHNIELRKKALTLGLTLNEYALTELKTKKWVAGKTEQEIYIKLGLKYTKPEDRI